LVLTRGITDSDVLYKWYQNIIIGKIERKSVTIILVDSQRNELKRWMYEKAFPIRWIGPSLKADSNALAIEKVEMVHWGLVRL
jgi:phage tail-like protein